LIDALSMISAGTSADEGVGICHAICEYLLNLKVCGQTVAPPDSGSVTGQAIDCQYI